MACEWYGTINMADFRELEDRKDEVRCESKQKAGVKVSSTSSGDCWEC